MPLPDLSSGSIQLPTSAGTTTIPNPFNRGYISSFNLTVQQQLGSNYHVRDRLRRRLRVRPVVNMNAKCFAPRNR